MGGHATHDEREARATFPTEWFAEWGKRDPIGLYEEYLVGLGIARERLTETEAVVQLEIDGAEREALSSRDLGMPAPESAARGVFLEG